MGSLNYELLYVFQGFLQFKQLHAAIIIGSISKSFLSEVENNCKMLYYREIGLLCGRILNQYSSQLESCIMYTDVRTRTE